MNNAKCCLVRAPDLEKTASDVEPCGGATWPVFHYVRSFNADCRYARAGFFQRDDHTVASGMGAGLDCGIPDDIIGAAAGSQIRKPVRRAGLTDAALSRILQPC